jgi:hypothetical protein
MTIIMRINQIFNYRREVAEGGEGFQSNETSISALTESI